MTTTATTECLAAIEAARAAVVEGRIAAARKALLEAADWLPRSGPKSIAHRERDARLQPCSTCLAEPGEPCVSGGMAMSGVHATRYADGA
jgi:hypothetical protein